MTLPQTGKQTGGLNGSKGRAKYFASMKRERLAEAEAAGVDVTDKKSVRQFHDAKFADLVKRIAGGRS